MNGKIEAIIFATDPVTGLIGQASLTVQGLPLVDIDVAVAPVGGGDPSDNPTAAMHVGLQRQFAAIGDYGPSGNVDRGLTGDVVWSTSDPTIASVTASGLVTSLKPGTVKVTFTAAMRGIVPSRIGFAAPWPTSTRITNRCSAFPQPHFYAGFATSCLFIARR